MPQPNIIQGDREATEHFQFDIFSRIFNLLVQFLLYDMIVLIYPKFYFKLF